jgi:hypothetical protein
MSEQSETVVTTTSASTAERNDPLAGVRQMAYAWIGLWSVAAEDFSNFYQRCVACGEQVMNAKSSVTQPEVKASAPAAVPLPKTTAARRIRPMSIFNAFGAVESYQIDLNAEGLLPTQQELDALSERVEALAREVEALIKQREPVA